MNLRVSHCDFLTASLMNAEGFHVVFPCRLVGVFIFTNVSEERTVGYVTTNDATTERMLKQTLFINKITALQRTRKNIIGRCNRRTRMICRAFLL